MVAPFDLDTLTVLERAPMPAPPPVSRRERRQQAEPALRREIRSTVFVEAVVEEPLVEPVEEVESLDLAFEPPVPTPLPWQPPRQRQQHRQRGERAPRPIRAKRRSVTTPSGADLLAALRRIPLRLVAVLGLVLVLVLVVVGGVRVTAAAPEATVSSTLQPTVDIAKSTVPLPWTPAGQSAVAVPSIGINVASGPEQAVPIASLTKIMTAYIILHDHPLGLHQSGPRLTMTQADVDDFNNDTVQDDSNAQVNLGEVLTERQLLGGMLVHSANNFADTLAVWDAGSMTAFIDKMNRTAAALGMTNSHFADPSGVSPGSESTASDLLRVAAPDMADPSFADIVDATSITLPVAGTITSYTPLIGTAGVIGVKSGFTTQAGGGDVLAVVREAHGLPVLVLSAVISQQGPNVLDTAANDALNLADSAGSAIGVHTIVHSGMVVAHVSGAGHTVSASQRGTAYVLSWPGIRVTRTFEVTHKIFPGAKAGAPLGSMVVTVGTQRVVLPVRLDASLPQESFSQKLF
jgi:D-alanyl-D-alanine carboxypeptidase (penicillin-binding protein 5/6)